HVCGPGARVVELARYPVVAVSWNPRLPGNPDLAAFLGAVPSRGAIGGFSDEGFTARTTAVAKGEAREGLAQTGGRRWLAAGGRGRGPGGRAPRTRSGARSDRVRSARSPRPRRRRSGRARARLGQRLLRLVEPGRGAAALAGPPREQAPGVAAPAWGREVSR